MKQDEKCGAEPPSRADLRRRKLIETARKLFVENGFHATGIAQIARESGIAVGQIYRDFSSKEEIVAALVEEDCRHFMAAEALDAAIRDGDRERVFAWLHHFVEPDDDPSGGRLFAEIVAESSRNERVAAIFASIHDRLRANLLVALTLLAPGEARAERRAVVADGIMTVSLGMLHHQLMRPDMDLAPLILALRNIIDEQIAALNAAEDPAAIVPGDRIG
ncbi:MAG TPA: TetR/AcrR family transcriptional regulator [Sphingomonas sp.]|jgi:AcrR family transcriptional regulator|uniref:TetR/AcrR family transcriptional regulator n=1 Tax=Sphingomonas sp. TaxID=28214 RepID=UPI002ED8F95A